MTGNPKVTETAAAGAGTVTFQPACECQVFVPGQTPITWLDNLRCADGAILTTDGAGAVTAHLVELKSKLKASDWPTVKQQLEGLMHNVKALCAVTGSPQPAQVRAYVAYKTDAISAGTTAAPALLKTPVGGVSQYSTVDWEEGQISLLGLLDIPLIKIVRDANGDGQAALYL